MNFVMGFIFTVMEDEELSFRSFIQLIDRNLLVSNNIYIYMYIIFIQKDILIQDLKNIRLFFYKLDRLIAINLPDLHHHFK